MTTVIIGGWLALRSTHSDGPDHDTVPAGSARDFNVLLVTLDTTRPDRIGCYGYAAAQTPNLDALAAHGVLFEDAVTCATSTLPAHATIHTGLSPLHHGAHENGRSRLAADHTTLAERLRQAGYATAAFVSCFVLDARFGLDQGFDTYEFKVGVGLRGEPASLVHERRADDTTRSASAWLKHQTTAQPDRPFFLWVHYFDPHYTYASPLDQLPQFENRPYDAEIAFVDLELGRLLDAVRDSSDLERTLIVVASDHGEGLGQHGESYHGIFLYESTLRTVLILSSPQLFPKAFRVSDRVVGTVDIVPTVLTLLGIAPEATFDGVDLLAAHPDPHRAIYIETYFSHTVGCSELLGLRRHADKFILAPRSEYYNLSSDPGETRNLIDEHAAQATALREQLSALRSAGGAAQEAYEMSDEERSRLAALGYVAALGKWGANWPDPKDKIDVINATTNVAQLLAQRRYADALPIAQQLVNECGAYDLPVRQLVETLEALGRTADAADVLQKYTANYPSVEMLVYAAERYRAWGRAQDAESALGAAELLDPTRGIIWKLRGDQAFEEGAFARAIDLYTRALQLDPQRLGSDVHVRLQQARQRAETAPPASPPGS
ncbi:MAG TPA: sulfatase-like hydrolase/transferase [Phycisphaerae bacterium]|nr:sulfatase-like hydrolase/transferase [Phycisphaerales bacterium]HRX84853.1 sulfatase-like hydrolase/transferase [Phycisphaerae bacterium]